MNGFTLLWSKILDSSIWMESQATRIVWITLLAMKDADGIVRAAKVALAHRARVTIEECDRALQVLMAPDPQSMTPANEGRRIKEIPGGWQILNSDLYRFSTESKREFWKQQKADQRARTKEAKEAKNKSPRSQPGGPLPGERRYVEAENRGDQAAADAIAAEGLPPTPEPQNSPDFQELE